MIRALTAALLLAPTLAEACVLDTPTCYDEATGGFYRSSSFDLADKPGMTTSVFEETGLGDKTKLYLVECISGRGVMADITDVYEKGLDREPMDYLTDAALSDETYTLREIREHLRQMGLETRMVTWPKGHCACELQTQPIIGCGDMD